MDSVMADAVSDYPVTHEVHVAALWSGYGSITRQYRTTPSGATLQLIEKKVSAPPRPPRQDDVRDASHTRKVKSYEVERYFYRHVAHQARNPPMAVQYRAKEPHVLLMEDLSVAYHEPSERLLSLHDALLVVTWLAHFHASFWSRPVATRAVDPQDEVDEEGVWEEGCYWVLRTRHEEYLRLSHEWQRLARRVDAEIRHIPSDALTLVHGDAKAANVMIHERGQHCALFDFQYVGRGPGVRDLVYLLVSSVAQVELHEAVLLQHYHQHLQLALRDRGLETVAASYTAAIMREHYELCVVDYYRFMLGWGLWGNVEYASSIVARVRATLGL